MQRSSGILFPISSLPSPYGIGTLGKAAYEFADFLSAAGQRYWQVLPIGPTGYGDSPYQSMSAFAGNPYFIDLDLLKEDGLLLESELLPLTPKNEERVDYGELFSHRYSLLLTAFSRGFSACRDEVEAFISSHPYADDYALFMALKQKHAFHPYSEWSKPLRLHENEAIERAREELPGEISFFRYLQYLFFRQWEKLRRYANERGVLLLGDIPIYVPLDSADTWAHPELFLLDGMRRPLAVAGVPPDYFSKTGQLWGNPLYDWDAMKQNGFSWWRDRISHSAALFDAVRIDHFRGLSTYWSVPYGEETAVHGEWKKGPSRAFCDMLRESFPNLTIIAEDLGQLSEDVYELLADSGFPGMRVLQFAFSPESNSAYLPHNHIRNSVCYTGTHDNTTLSDWLATAPAHEVKFAREYLGLNREEGECFGMIRGGMGSVANLFIAQMQDYLELDGSCRMNTPGTAQGNWVWRMRRDALTPALAQKIRAMTHRYGRC